MKIDRILELECTDAKLTEDEISEGWHFCPDWDFMIVGPGTQEIFGCNCEKIENSLK